MKDRTQKGCLIKAWKKIAKRLDKRHTTTFGFGHPGYAWCSPCQGPVAFWPPGSVTRVTHGAALVRIQSPFGFSPHRKKL